MPNKLKPGEDITVKLAGLLDQAAVTEGNQEHRS